MLIHSEHLLFSFRISITGIAEAEAETLSQEETKDEEKALDEEMETVERKLEGGEEELNIEEIERDIEEKVKEIIKTEVLGEKAEKAPILMVNVKNVYHEPVVQSQEMKVI